MAHDGTEALLSQTGWTRRLARRLVRDEGEAEDLAQEVALAALRRPPRREGPVRGWLATVLRNLAHNRRKADSRRRERQSEVARAAAAEAPSPEQTLTALQTHRLLTRLIEGLPAEDRQLIVLRYFEERSSDEIGRLLAQPAATVRWRLRAVIQQLRSRLDEEHSGSRRRWLLVLGPLARRTALPVEASAAPWLLGFLLAVGLSALVVVAVVAAPDRDHRRPPRTDLTGAGRASAPALPPGGRVPGRPTVLASAVAGCPTALAAARQELAAMEQDLRRFEPSDRFFSEALPSTRAQLTMAPLLAQLGDGQHQGGALECREWICRVLLARDPALDVSSELKALESLWRERAADHVDRIASLPLGGIARDPLSGSLHQTHALYLHLRGPTGKPEPAAPPPAAPDCPGQVARARSAIGALAPRQQRALPPPERHRRAGAIDGAATAQVARELRRALGSEGAALRVDCRVGFCRIDLEPAPHALTWARFDERLRADARAGELLPASWRGAGDERYFRVGPRPEPADVADRTAAWRAFSGAVMALVKTCSERHPDGERVMGRVLTPGPGELNLDGEPDRPSFRLTGPGAEGPLGHCVRAGLPRTFQSAPLPVGLQREMIFHFMGKARARPKPEPE